ncbi:MAG: DUF11 domain-containing protein [Pirellulaceae bacterium]|nr:DUF11 domain-containing protein [Pirellulaceae bacterium]
MASIFQRLFAKFSKRNSQTRRSRTHRVRTLRLEPMERRCLMAGDIATIGGNVFTDLTENGLTGDDTALVGVTVRLFRDGGNATFESSSGTAGGDDTLVGAPQVTDGSGNYLFTGLTAGTYFVQQAAATGRLQRPAETVKTVVITEPQAGGTGVTVLDNFTDATASLVADSGTPTISNFTVTSGSNTLGGERDMIVNHVAGGANVRAEVTGGLLDVNLDVGTSGNVILIYDGVDSDATTISHVNLSQNLTSGGASAFQFLAGATLAGNTLTIDVFSGSGNRSSETVNIPQTAGGLATEVVIVPYSAFSTVAGSGANFANVTALRIQIDATAGNDAQFDLTQTVAPFLSQQNFANLNPMSIGDRVWRDSNNNGALDVGETGIQNVTVQLYEDDGDGLLNTGVDTLVGTDTTDGTGNYLFQSLLPGDYFVVIPDSEFAGGGDLFGFTPSSIFDAPNDDTNNQNKGIFVVGVGAVSAGVITLTAGGEPTTDGDSDANTNLAQDFGFTPEFDLEITKIANAANITAGGQVTYTLNVTNNGPGTATNVLVVDDLPDFMTVVSVVASGSTNINQSGPPTGEIEVEYASFASGESRVITIIASVPANHAAQANVVNTATVIGDGIDSDDDNNEDTANINVIRQAVLEITKTDTPDPNVVGQTLNYQIVVTNNGPSTATNLEIRDTLPAGLTFVSVNSTVGTPTHVAGLISLDLPTLAVGASVTINVVTTIQSSFSGSTISNSATADADEAELVTGDSSTTVNPSVDLVITKSDSADPISRGSQLTYTLNVSNDGPGGATNVEVVDTLPVGVTYVSASSSIVGAVITPPTAPSRDVSIALGNMAAGATGTITIIVTVDQDAGNSLSNTAIIRSTESLAGFDSNAANNTDTETTATGTTIDLEVTKVDSATVGNPIRPGGTITYTLTARNNGPSDATGVRVVDNIPDGIQVTSATIGATPITIPASASDTTAANPDDLTFNIGALASGASATLTVIANVLPGFRSDLVNTAVISTTDSLTDSNPNNNTATVTSPLSPLVDIAVVKSSPSGASVIPGNALVYHIDVTNNGPSTATGVTLSDTLPAGLTFVSVSSTQGTALHASGVITGNLGDIAPGATVRVTVNTTVNGTTRGTLNNTATATPTETDSNSSNNSSTLITTLTPQIDLQVTKAKTNPSDPALAGGPMTYTIIVTNAGPSAATDVVMTDVLPNGLTFNQGSSTVGTVAHVGQTVTASIGNLASGASATITLLVDVSSTASGTFTNTATVTGTETDTNTNNNTSTLNTPVAVNGSIAGRVYVDVNRNGVFDSGDTGLGSVDMALTGTDILGRTVSRTAATNPNGEYTFDALPPGSYSVIQTTQPLGFTSAQNNVGTPAGGTAGDNQITNVVLTSGINAISYNFGEVPNPLSKRRFLASSSEFD